MATGRNATRFGRGLGLVAVAAALLVPAVVWAGPSGGALPPALVRILHVTELTEIPDDADMVAVNITATRAAGGGYFTAYPCDEDTVPGTSNVNYLADDTVPNMALVRLADDGTICIATSEISDLVVDVIGYVPAGSAIRPLAAPDRVADTRDTAVQQPGDVLRVAIGGTEGPLGVDADVVMANLTAISRGGTGYLTAYPCSPEVPGTSSVNFGPAQVKANFVISRLDDDGDLCITTSEPADIVVDVAGFATDGITTLPEPVRIADTRSDGVPVSTSLDLDVVALGRLPDTSTAAVYNLTAARATAGGYATSHPCLATPPTASNLNFLPGPAVANGTITKLSDDGRLCIDVSVTTDLVVDLIGYTTDTAHYVPITPTRIEDTRQGWQSTCPWIVGEQLDDDQLLFYNVATGDRRTAALPPGEPGALPTSSLTAIVTRDCDGVLYIGLAGLYFLGFDGSSQLQPIVSDDSDVWGISGVGTLYERSDGQVVLVDRRVTALPTRTVLGPGVQPSIRVGPEESGEDAYLGDVGLSDDGSLMVGLYSTNTASFVVTHDGAGIEIDRVELPAKAHRIDVSPSGTYIAVDTLPDLAYDGFAASIVFTRFLDPVDLVYGTNVAPTTQFLGDGELVACVSGAGLFRWDLFGPLDFLLGQDSEFMSVDCGTLGARL